MAMGQTHAALFVVLALVVACSDAKDSRNSSARATLPPIFPKGPASTTNWNSNAGALLLVAAGNTDDSATLVLPDVTDSTIAFLHGTRPAVSGVIVDLFGRSGKIESGASFTVTSPVDSSEGCFTWPSAKLRSPRAGWAVGFAAGHVAPIRLDSIEAMPSVDSAALAAALTQSAALLPVTSDPAFRGLPFRVRSAYSFRFDSIDAVVADVVRSVNEEANPRLEHLLLIGEKPVGTTGKYSVVYYNRSAGAEESTPVTELMAMVLPGRTKQPVAVINVEYGDGGRFGLLERRDDGRWRPTWRSAYTGC